MLIGRDEVEQHDADAERLVWRHSLPEMVETGEQKARVARLEKVDFLPPAAEIGGPGKMQS